MNGFASEKLIELQARAGDSKVAASAVRPPASTHRGRRSRNARCRRWDLWHAHVSQSLISLMPTVPFVVSKAGPEEQVASAFCGAASGCVSACASASAFALRAAPAPASVAAPAAAFAAVVDEPPAQDTVASPLVNVPASGAAGQPGRTAPHVHIEAKFRIFHLNVNNMDAHLAQLDALLALHDFPEFVAITETHLCLTVAELKLTNYLPVSRRDRADQSGWGGIALYARYDVHSNIVHIRDSEKLELSWHTLHSDVGPLLIGVWYRPPCRGQNARERNLASIAVFEDELDTFNDFVGRIIIGDMNVHSERWLRFSNGESPEGLLLESVCSSQGLKQHVKSPSRGEYLLDLVLSDLGSQVRCTVHPGVLDSDHRCVLAQVDISIATSSPSSRMCFDFGKANWPKLRKVLRDSDWKAFFDGKTPDDAALQFTDFLLSTAKNFIPMKTVSDKPYKHPWIDDQCVRLLRAKHEAIGTSAYALARDQCTEGFRKAQASFLTKTRDKLRNSGSKDWWSLSKDLLAKSSGRENIPPLRSGDTWAKDPQSKASLLATTFSEKAQLPEPHVNEYTVFSPARHSLRRFLRIRERDVRKILKSLDVKSATGPDLLPALILKVCGDELALPIAIISRLCLSGGRWPLCWRCHWIHPLHKNKAKSDPKNYRGAHLTPQLAKVVERAVGAVFVPWLGKHGFGEHQYAYSLGKSHRDVLAINVCSWLLSLEDGLAVGLFCSDVRGAFDRVCRQRLGAKLRVSGLPPDVISFLESWLEDRIATVVVSGAKSESCALANSVFQGTVLGPPLWNFFYADARFAVRDYGFIETVFADDFNCWTILDKDATALEATLKLSECQSSLHRWGAANRVCFDPLKEEFVVIRRRKALGSDFKLLGVTFDAQLLMHSGVRKIAVEAGWRLKAILRARSYFTTPELFRLYKANVLSYIESGVAGYFHACDSTLDSVDRIQIRFLRSVGLSEEEALLSFRLAPLKMRRCIAILGFLHRVVLGLVSPQILDLFPRAAVRDNRDSISERVRGVAQRHDKQLLDRVHARSSEQFKRSIFGMVQCYNALPQDIVNQDSISGFQQRLQLGVMNRIREGRVNNWQNVFRDGRSYASLIRFQSFFR